MYLQALVYDFVEIDELVAYIVHYVFLHLILILYPVMIESKLMLLILLDLQHVILTLSPDKFNGKLFSFDNGVCIGVCRCCGG